MAGSGKKWLIGCGIGCGVVLLILGGVGTVGYFGVRNIIDRADTVEDSFEDMETAYGQVEDYTPPADGGMSPDRVETFLTVRDQLIPMRSELGDKLSALSGEDTGGGAPNWLAKIRAGVSFVPTILAYGSERNRVLLNNDMSLGEYLYLYALAYYVYLEMSPGDGPTFKMVHSDDEEDSEGFRFEAGDSDPEEVREERERHFRTSLHRLLEKMARNQLAALDRAEAASPGSIPSGWREALTTELGRMDAERRRLLWEDGLPEQIRAAFAPYGERLRETYDPMVNAIETGLTSAD